MQLTGIDPTKTTYYELQYDIDPMHILQTPKHSKFPNNLIHDTKK